MTILRNTVNSLPSTLQHREQIFLEKSNGAVVPYIGNSNNNPVRLGNYSDSFVGVQRLQAIFDAQRIRDRAGVPDWATTGLESGVTAGLSNSGALSADTAITITQESDASTEAASGSGTEADPYVIENKQLDNSETANIGFDWNDSDASYYIKLLNCEIHSYGDYQIRVNTSSKLFIESCLIYDNNQSAYGVRLEGGSLDVQKVNFAGLGDDALYLLSSGDLVAINCSFDDSQIAWASNGAAIHVNIGDFNSVTVQHCDFQMNNLSCAACKMSNDAKWTIEDCYGEGIQSAFTPNMQEDTVSPVRMRRCEWKDMLESVTVGGGNTFKDLIIEYCYFNDCNNGNRLVDLQNDPEDCIVRFCRFNKATGDGSPGNECCEAFDGKNITFHDCWAEQGNEDAFEFVRPKTGCDMYNLVGDNVSGQIADYFSAISGEQGGEVHHIYGDSNDVPVLITDVSNIKVWNVYAETSQSTKGGVVIEQRNEASGTAPNNCKVYGPLPLKESVGSDGPFATEGTVGTGNQAVWFEDEEIKTYNISDTSDLVIR